MGPSSWACRGPRRWARSPRPRSQGYAQQMLAAERAGLGPSQAASQMTEVGKQAWRAGQAAVMGEQAREAMDPTGKINRYYTDFYAAEADRRKWNFLDRSYGATIESIAAPGFVRDEEQLLTGRAANPQGFR